MSTSPAHHEDAPPVPLLALDHVWFQITGTLCNLRCRHCFIRCAPDNDAFAFMPKDLVDRTIEDAVRLGAREFYFTGGEPFMHPEIVEVLTAAVHARPTTVLTNAMLFKEAGLARLAAASDQSGNTLTFRVSLDGHTAEMNDAIRGAGVFDKTLAGIAQLVRHGFEPIITIVRTWEGCDEGVLSHFADILRAAGYARPRLKVLPSLKLGAEIERTSAYPPCARVTREMMDGYDVSQLLCSHSRLVTDRGVWVCPILLDAPDARLGATLADSLQPYPLRHAACSTCYHNGAICSNSESPVPVAAEAGRPSCSAAGSADAPPAPSGR